MLRGFGIPVEGPAEVFCDDLSVVKNSSIPTSALNKRHNYIYYHKVRKAQAAGIFRVGWIPGEFNLVKLFTKTIMPENKKHNLVDSIFLVILIRSGFIFTWMHLSNYHTIRVVRRKWVLVLHTYILFKFIIYGYEFSGTTARTNLICHDVKTYQDSRKYVTNYHRVSDRIRSLRVNMWIE